jgi:uncharacterized protein (DUF2336 family)
MVEDAMTEENARQTLSADDVRKLIANPSAENRADTSEKLARQFSAGDLSDSECKIAEDIFRALVKDVEVKVREALSTHLKSSPDVPHDVAVALAKDVDSVALPMLRFSEVLTDDDLIEIVRGPSGTKQIAIAQRARVSSTVADALIDTGNETAVARLVSNEGADLTERSLGKVMTKYKSSESVSNSMSRRASLPPAISEQLVEAITQRLQDYLNEKHELSADVASNLIFQARERATMSLVRSGSSDADLDSLIERLHQKRRLTPSLLLRALCMGDMAFFERAIARLSEVPLQNVRILIHDQGKLGLESIYIKANLPRRWLPAFRAAVDLANEAEYDGELNDRSRYVERMVERMLTHFEDPTSRLAQEDIDFLMAQLEQVAA